MNNPPDTVADATRQGLAILQNRRIPQRIRERDHTVWRPDSQEIADRLGWLDAGEFLRPHLPQLTAFADRIRNEGYRDVLLLGMGGSSLGPEMLRRSLLPDSPSSPHPRLTLLDSTIPEQITAVAAALDPARTLFIVSSKSGGTIETLSLYRYFRGLVESASLPSGRAPGDNFIAITDAGTSLDRLAQESGFRRVFLNPPDIGGRFSVLSWFGMLPAALAGIDVPRLLDSAARMRERCLAAPPDGDNPGLALGALLGQMALNGRDKMTLIPTPPIDSFGLWVEQMIAESLGKDGRGIIPIAGEPILSPDAYGDDRLFIYMRVDAPAAQPGDDAVAQLESAGHPVARINLSEPYDLGAEIYRWEYATAVAAALLNVHPFDQPDVQSAKDNTDRLLTAYLAPQSPGYRQLPAPAPDGSLTSLLDQAQPGDYLALILYVPPDTEADGPLTQTLNQIRARIMQRRRIATTVGYGPRYLHSSGQLHKGGPATGLYIQMTMNGYRQLPIPGEGYDFAALATLQATGDRQALETLSRRLITINLGDNAADALRELLNRI